MWNAKKFYGNIAERAAKALGKNGIDLEEKAKRSGHAIAQGWNTIGRAFRGIARAPDHENRITSLEKEMLSVVEDVRDVKKWILDVDNRTALLEHHNNYDLDDVLCPVCASPMRVKKNSKAKSFFFGCSNFGRSDCRGTRPVSDPYLQKLASRYLAA